MFLEVMVSVLVTLGHGSFGCIVLFLFIFRNPFTEY